MKFLIVEGIEEVRELYRLQLSRLFPYAQIVESFSAEDALFSFFENNPNLVISSDTLSVRSGCQLSGVIHQIDKNVPVIIISTDGSNAIEAIKNQCFDMLLTPVSDERMNSSILKAIEFIGAKSTKQKANGISSTKVKLSEGKGYKVLNLDDIVCFIADGSYTKILFENGTVHFSSYFLGRIEKNISGTPFMRINRSTIVNPKYVKLIDKSQKHCVMLMNDEGIEFKISRLQIKKLEEEKFL